MIAPADFCQPAIVFAESSCADDSLVPGADPYIVQLMEEHRAELLSRSRLTPYSRPRATLRRSDLELAVA